MSQEKTVKVVSSWLPPLEGSTVVGDSDPAETVTLTVRVRPRSPRGELEKRVHEIAAQPLAQRRHLTRDEFARQHGADPADLATVEGLRQPARSGSNGLERSCAGPSNWSDRWRPSSSAFGVDLKVYRHGDTHYRGHAEHAEVPAELGPIVEAIFGFDNRRYARPHFRLAKAACGYESPRQAATSFNPNQVAACSTTFPRAPTAPGRPLESSSFPRPMAAASGKAN